MNAYRASAPYAGCARFDGALDVHLTRAVGLRQALIDQVVAYPLTALMLWIGARIAQARPRLVDLLMFVGVARLLLVPLGVLGYLLMPPLPGSSEQAMMAALSDSLLQARLLLVFVATAPFLCVFVVLLLQGYRTATGLRGVRLGISFPITLILAEVVSKVLLSLA